MISARQNREYNYKTMPNSLKAQCIEKYDDIISQNIVHSKSFRHTVINAFINDLGAPAEMARKYYAVVKKKRSEDRPC